MKAISHNAGPPEGQTRPGYPTFKEAFRFWLKLGFISFGGPAGQIAIMHEFLVVRQRWISESRFLHALNYCMILPGPEAQQLATYTGWLLHGTRGGLTAGLLFILPSVFILLSLSVVYVTFGKLAWVASIFYGLKPAVVAIVVLALIKIAGKSLHSVFSKSVAILSFCSIFFFHVSFPVIVLFSIAIGLIMRRIVPASFTNESKEEKVNAGESQYVINNLTPAATAGSSLRSVLLKVLVGIALWIIPILLFWSVAFDFSFWFSLSSFFTKAAFVTFGGAYAVLPYVAQVSVEKFHWLSGLQMIDGMALGETTPGPLIMVLVFVGFMAGYNQFSASIAAGALGLFTTAYYTFLPSFLFIMIGAPFVEKTKENTRLKEILTIVTAAVVGVILNLTIYFGKAILFPSAHGLDWFAFCWLIVSFLAMYGLRVNMILWIAVSGLAGLIYSFLWPLI